MPGAKDPWTDRRAPAESTVLVNDPNDHWYSWDVTNLVQDWLSGAFPNNGVIVEAAEKLNQSFAFGCVAGAYPHKRPRLVVEYDLPTPTPTPTATPTELPSATLLPLKLVQPTAALPGSIVRYTLAVMNDQLQGGDPGTSVELRDVLPTQVQLIAGSLTGSATYEESTHTIRWQGQVPRGQGITIEFQARLDAAAQPGASVVNELVVTDAFSREERRSVLLQVAQPSTLAVPLVVKGHAFP
jgi:uncharacterized repeat protein (TIGR01451 family)